MSQLENNHERLVSFTMRALSIFKNYIEYNQNIVEEFKTLQKVGTDFGLDLSFTTAAFTSETKKMVNQSTNTDNEFDALYDDELPYNDQHDESEFQKEITSDSQYIDDITELLSTSQNDFSESFADLECSESNRITTLATSLEKTSFEPIELKESKQTNRAKRIKLRQKKNMCHVCHKYFYSPSHLKVHLRIHSNERPYKCETCNMNFTTSGNLKTHQRVHSTERPFACDQCEMTFKLLHHLKDHQLGHLKKMNLMVELDQVKPRTKNKSAKQN